MSNIEKRARELVTALMQDDPDEGESWEKMARRKVTAALTPPEGWVLVPAEPTEAQWGGLARDVVMWMECYQTRSADSLLKHLSRCGTEIPKWLMDEVKGGSHSLDKGTVAAIIYKAMITVRPEVK